MKVRDACESVEGLAFGDKTPEGTARSPLTPATILALQLHSFSFTLTSTMLQLRSLASMKPAAM